MTTYRALLPVALAVALTFSPRANAGAGFNDGNFTNYTWNPVEIQDTTAGQTAVFSTGEVLTGGFNGGAWRSNSFAFSYNGTLTNQGIIIGNLSGGITYSPSVSGQIDTISSFSISCELTASSGTPATSVALLLQQGGFYYTNQFQGFAGFGIPVKEPPMQSNSFTQVGSSGPLNPDFSTNGAPIEFGYAVAASLSTGSATSVTGTIGADLYALSISNTPSMPRFIGQQLANATNLSVTLTGLAVGETITWLVSTNLATWSTNNPTGNASDTNGTFTVTNSAYPAAPKWFLRAIVQ